MRIDLWSPLTVWISTFLLQTWWWNRITLLLNKSKLQEIYSPMTVHSLRLALHSFLLVWTAMSSRWSLSLGCSCGRRAISCRNLSRFAWSENERERLWVSVQTEMKQKLTSSIEYFCWRAACTSSAHRFSRLSKLGRVNSSLATYGWRDKKLIYLTRNVPEYGSLTFV